MKTDATLKNINDFDNKSLLIVDDDNDAGLITFNTDNYIIQENTDIFYIPVNRIGGVQGKIDSEYKIEKVKPIIVEKISINKSFVS